MSQQNGKAFSSLKKLKKTYNKIPKIDCEPGCTECCGIVPISRDEARNIGINDRRLLPVKDDGITCAYVCKTGCSIYKKRPVLCRLMGVVEKMPCPKRQPERMLTQKEEDELMNEIFHGKISGQMSNELSNLVEKLKCQTEK